MKLLINIIFIISTLLFFNKGFSQYCNTATTNVTITPTTTSQLTTSYSSGRRAFKFVATAGCTYEFSTCSQTAGDTYLRLYSTGTGGTLLSQNDDACGTQSTLTWTSTVNGTVSILLTRFSCNTLSVATRMSYKLVNCNAPPCTTPISPTNNLTGTTIGQTLSWNSVNIATSYDVYFGTTSNPPFVVNQTGTTYNPGTLSYNTTYYWKIIPKNSSGVATGCSIWSFTTSGPGCLNAPYGQYPSSTFYPSCTGTAENITTVGYAGEYSVVNLISSVNYTFSSSVSTDYITITNAAGTTVLAYGIGSVIYNCTTDNDYRFYTHTNNLCGTINVSRTRRIQCSAPPPPANDLVANAQLVNTCGEIINGNTKFATNTGDGPNCLNASGEQWTSPGLWYKVVGNGENINISLCGSSFDTKLYVYLGTPGSFTCLTSNDDFCSLQSVVDFISTANTTYYVLVTGYGSAKGSFTMTVTPSPSLPIITSQPQNNTICAGQQTTFSVAATGNQGPLTYQWYLNGNVILNANSTAYTTSTAGNYYVKVINSCGVSIQSNTVNLVVGTIPVLTSTNQNVSCYGNNNGSINLTVTNTTGSLIYSWAGPNGFISNLEDISNLQPGTYTVTVTTSIGCSATSSFTITQPSLALSVTATSNGFDCSTNTAQIVVSASGGTLPYNGTGTFTVNNTGTYNYTVTDANGCSQTTSIIISGGSSGNLTLSDIQGNTNICDSLGNGYIKYWVDLNPDIISYNWTVPNGIMIYSGQGTNKIFVEVDYSFTGGSITVIGQGSCGTTTPEVLYIDLTPTTPVWVSNSNCGYANLTETFTVTTSPNANVVWTAPLGSVVIQGQGTPEAVIKFSQSFTGGLVEVYAENACGTSDITELFVGAVPAYPISITGSNIVCNNQQQVYSTNLCDSADYYIWNVPSGASIVGNALGNSITVQFSGFVSGNITVMSANECGSSPMRSLNISTTNINPATTIFGPTNACTYIGGSPVTYSTPIVNGITNYIWTVPNGVTIISGQGTSSLSVSFTNSFIGGNIAVSLSNGCGVSMDRILSIISSQSVTSGNISGPTAVCSYINGTFATYSIPTVNGASAYNWTAPIGSTILNNGNNTVQISYPTGFTTGSVSVSVVFNCGPNANRTLSVSTIPQNVTIVGPSCVIPGQLNIFTINGGVGATNFTWSITGNASITSGQGTSNITINFGMNFTTGTLSVTPSSNCCSGLTTQTSIGVQAATVANIIGPSTLCVGDIVQYTVDNLAGISYLIWDFPTGINITNSNTANIVEIYVTPSFAGGDMSVQRVNYCGSSPMRYKALSLCQNSSSEAPNQEYENGNELNTEETVVTKVTNSDNDVWDEEEKINFILYPNPGKGIIQFRIYRGDKDNYKVTIKNTIGQVVYQSEHKPSDKMILDNLESGFYYVTATDDELNTITKILVIN